MHLDVPFFPSWATPGHPGGIHCQEACIKMILGYYWPDKTFSAKQLEAITGYKPEKASWQMQSSIWYVDHGFELIEFSPFDFEQFRRDGMDYIRKTYGDDVAEWQIKNSDIDSVSGQLDDYIAKVKHMHKKPTLQDIITYMHDGYLIRASVNSGFLDDKDTYVGHSVVVTGFDDRFTWFHDPGLPAVKNRKVTHQKFQAAMDSFGHEMDAIKLDSDRAKR